VRWERSTTLILHLEGDVTLGRREEEREVEEIKE
jgi:hypothetical protein